MIHRDFEQLVGGTRFELVTPSMSTKCATTAPTALATKDSIPSVYRHVNGVFCAFPDSNTG